MFKGSSLNLSVGDAALAKAIGLEFREALAEQMRLGGHPVKVVDGHLTSLPVGDVFPATPEPAREPQRWGTVREGVFA